MRILGGPRQRPAFFSRLPRQKTILLYVFNLIMAQHPDMPRQWNEIGVSESLRVRLSGRDRSKEKAAQSSSGFAARRLCRHDGVFIVDQRVGVGAWRLDKR